MPLDLAGKLGAAARAGTLTGTSLAGMADLLTSLGLSSLTISNGTVTTQGDAVVLSASVGYLNVQWSLTLSARDPGASPERAALDLRLAPVPPTASVTLATLFDPLPRSRVPQTDSTVGAGGGLELVDSVLAPMSVSQPVVLASNGTPGAIPPARLQGWLTIPPDGTFGAAYVWLLPLSPLWMDGTLKFAAVDTIPKITLDATVPGFFVPLRSLELTAGLRLVNHYPDPAPLPDKGAPLSAVLVFGKASLPIDGSEPATFTAPLLLGDYIWPFHVAFDPPLTLDAAGRAITSLIGGEPSDFALPAGIKPLSSFGISDLEFGYLPSKSGLGSVEYSSVTITSTTCWIPPIPFVVVNRVGASWVLSWSGATPLVTAKVWGTMTFGREQKCLPAPAGSPGGTSPADDSLQMTVSLELPDLFITAYNERPMSVDFGTALQPYFGSHSGGGSGTGASLTVTQVEIIASLVLQTYQAVLEIEGDVSMSCNNVTFGFESMQLIVVVASGTASGMLTGTAKGVIDGKTVRLSASAEYDPEGAWVFDGGLADGTKLPLVDLVTGFFGSRPAWVDDTEFAVDVTDFWVRYSTASGNPFTVRGAILIRLTVLDTTFSLLAEAEVERRLTGKETETEIVGAVSGTISVNRLAVTVGISFAGSTKTYMFKVAFGKIALTGTTRRVDEPTPHDVLTLRLIGLTLGDVVEELVHLANPNVSARLDPPWDFLYSIDLGRASLEIDQTLQTVTLAYDFDLTLPFLSLKKVGVVYDRSSGTPSVKWVLEGRLLGDAQQKRLEWDAVDDAPPAIPGKGQKLFDLRYLAVGQHVSPKPALTSFNSIPAVIEAMEGSMTEIDPTKPDAFETLTFDPSSGWLFGLDCSVMDTLDVQLVLHDPDFYGMRVALHGGKAGSLAGFSFELLYKKVTSDIGVFHARLEIPDAFRSLQFGAVSVTLGVITVDIYTNGNFRVDLGFPHDRVFDSSFAFEVGIFNGRGGIYFGILNGATSTKVPAITNGVFSPVIELGIGLQVGVGRTFEKGPLKAGLYVNLEAIVEGALAWFHPTDSGSPVEMYYWCRGTVGIVGKLYGSIDFQIISASISIEAHADATITFAAYEKTLVELDVGVEVEAKVEFLFFSVSFHYETSLQASFTIGETTAAPWTLASGSTERTQTALTADAHAPRRRRPADTAAFTRAAYLTARFGAGSADGRVVAAPAATGKRVVAAPAATDDGYHLAFDKDAQVFPNGEVREASLKLGPAFTIAGVPVDWGNGAPASEGTYSIVFLLAADCPVPPTAKTIEESRQPTVALNAQASIPAETSFEQIAEAMLRWSLDALGVHGADASVKLGELEELVDQLALPDAAKTSFSWENLDGFLGKNLSFRVSLSPAGATGIGAVPFPMPPGLKWTGSDPEQDRDFSKCCMVDAAYESAVIDYFAPLDPRPKSHKPDTAKRLAAAADAEPESMARFITRDFFLMTARTVAQAAVDLLARYPHPVAASDSLDSIAKSFSHTTVPYVKRAGDTPEEVARHFGMSVSEIGYLDDSFDAAFVAADDGAEVQVPVGVTPGSIAAANPGWSVVPGKTIRLGGLTVAVNAGDTLSKIALRYGTTPGAWLRKSAAVMQTKGLLRAKAQVALGSFSFANAGSAPLDTKTVAAVFYVRLPVSDEIPLLDWYEQTVAELNPIPPGGDVPAIVVVPAAYDTKTPAAKGWTTLPGDTLRDIAAYHALLQNAVVAGSPFALWLQQIQSLNPSSTAAPVVLPASSKVTVAEDDTLQRLQTRLLVDPDVPAEVAMFVSAVAGADALVPLASVLVDGATATTVAGQSLLSLAESCGVSVEDLGMRMAIDEGVLATSAGETLTVPGVPEIDLVDLVEGLHQPIPSATVAGQVARFMLHGLRLPAPDDAAAMTGLYELVGQQLAGPVPQPDTVVDGNDPTTPDDPPDALLTLTVTKGEAASWLQLATAAATAPGETPAGLVERHPDVLDLNPALAAQPDDEALPEGMVVQTGATDSLVVEITAADLAQYPARVLDRDGVTVEPLPTWRDVPVRHPLTQLVPWQTTVAPLLPDATPAGSTSFGLWMLPRDLLAAASAGETPLAYRLMQAAPHAGPTAAPVEVGAYAWATIVRFGVRSVPGSAGIVEIAGADTADRQRLARLVQYVRAHPPPADQAHVRLLWQPAVSAGAAPGLASTALDPSTTFLVKTNLSTETHSGRMTLRAAAVPVTERFFASLADADAASFLTLLWECSVVGGGGYWLRYADGAIPSSIFDQDGNASLTLLVQLDSQSLRDTTRPVRNLLSANNCAIVAGGVDAASVGLWAAAAADAETERRSAIPAGQVGFTLGLTNPDGATLAPAQKALQSLYSLVGYQLAETSAFRGSSEGRPVGPQAGSGTQGDADTRPWTLTQVLPIARFAKTLLAPDDALPAPSDDPYAGINGAVSGDEVVAADAAVDVWFHDVFGNASSTANGDAHQLTLPVTYTDPLLGAGAWPSTVTSYGVSPDTDGGADLVVQIALQAVEYQPHAREGGKAGAERAARDRDRFAAVHYQVSQHDVSAALLTTLRQSGQTPSSADVPLGPLRSFVSGAYVLLSSLSSFRSATAPPGLTLDEVCSRYGVGYPALADTNAAAEVAEALGASSLQVPAIHVWMLGESVASVCEAARVSVDPVAVLKDEDNVLLPLAAGTEITIPSTSRQVPDPSPPPVELVAAFGCTLESLVSANSATPGLLTPGFVFEVNDLKVTVPPDPPEDDQTVAPTTLDLAAGAFESAYGITVDAGQLVARNADKPNMFRTGVAVSVTGYVAKAGDTLTVNGSGHVAADLASCNATTVGLFPVGTPLVLGATTVQIQPGNTLARVAATWGVSAGEILRHNGTVQLPAGTSLVVPGVLQWPEDGASVRVPYVIRAGDTLSSLAPSFLTGAGADGDSAQTVLARINLSRAGLVSGSKNVSVGGATVRTEEGDSFQDVIARFSSPVALADLVAAVQDTAGILAEGALLVCPPGRTAAASGETTVGAAATAQSLGLSATELLAANSGTPDLLAPGQELKASPADPSALTTAAHDTFTALLARFHDRKIPATVDSVVQANPGLLLNAGAAFVLPPRAARVSAALGDTTGDTTTWELPSPVFPIHVWLELARARVLVDPALAGTEADPSDVVRVRTPVPAARSSADEGAATLSGFATALEKAMPVVRVATGKVLSEQDEVGGTDVWAVVVGSGGVTSVDLVPRLDVAGTTGPQPRAFALRPLSTSLVSRQEVSTKQLGDDGKLADTTDTRSYNAVDLDVWARAFLSDVELVLSGAYVTGAKLANASALTSLLATKKDTLADAVASGLDYVFEGESTGDPSPLTDAVEALRQQLLLSLLSGYDAAAVLQYDAQVDSPWTTEYARLSGSAVITPGADAGKVSLIGSKIPLKSGTSHVNFVVNAPDVAEHQVVEVPLSFHVVELEFGITRDPTGYERSDWLSFVNELPVGEAPLKIDLGTPSIPFPLRAYPPLPAVLDHAAVPPPDAEPEDAAPRGAADPVPPPRDGLDVLDPVLEWSYRFEVRHQSVDQDEIHVLLELNEASAAQTKTSSSGDSLFDALAQYNAISANLMAILAELKGPLPSAIPARLYNALQTFADQVAAVASAWRAHWTQSNQVIRAAALEVVPALPAKSHEFVLEPIPGQSGIDYAAVRLTHLDATTETDLEWPSINWIDGSGARRELHMVATGEDDPCDCPAGAVCRCYTFPAVGAPDAEVAKAWAPLTLELVFGGLAIGSYQSARGSVYVQRNAQLLDPPGAATCAGFVYRTPRAGFPEPVVPLIDVTRRLEVGEWTYDGATNPLAGVFAKVFGPIATPRTISLMAGYEFELVAGDPPLESWLPAKLSPASVYDDHTVGDLVDALSRWATTYRPETTRGRWGISLSMYSSLGRAVPRPVLRLRNLVFDLPPPPG